MPELNIDFAFFTLLCRTSAYREAVDLQVNDKLFASPLGRQQWKFAQEYYSKHGETLSVEAMRSKFPEFKAQKTKRPMTDIVELLRGRMLHNAMVEATRKAKVLLSTGMPFDAFQAYSDMVRQGQKELMPSKDIDWVTSFEARKNAYEELKNNQGLIGVPMPFESLTELTGGIAPGEVWYLLARKKIGKTFFLTFYAVYLWSLGYDVLFFTKEMTTKQIMRRIDAFDAKVSFEGLKRGILSTKEEEKWEAIWKNRSADDLPFLIVSGDTDTVTPLQIDLKVDKYRPHIVLIDGGYLLKDDEGSSSRNERLSNIAKAIKMGANSDGIPRVVSYQFHRGGKGKGEEATSDNIFGADIAMDADGIIGQYQSLDMKYQQPQRMRFRLLDTRESSSDWEREVIWDLVNMEIRELTAEEEEQYTSAGIPDEKDINVDEEMAF